MTSHALLEVRDLQTWFETPAGVVPAVDGIDLRVERGETLALVGESGSGKSVTAASLLRLVAPPGRIVGGEVLLDGVDLLKLDARALRAVRGGRIGMVFQDLSALNPVERIGTQIAEAIRLHAPAVTRRAAWSRAVELLERVRMPSPAERAHEVPHRLSGGMRQRALIALALACGPQLLIADEPTTALDVTTQAQILALLKELQRDTGMGLLLITHDLGVVAQIADRAAVMYAGRIVEEAPVAALFESPQHPYTAGLLGAVALERAVPGTRLPEIGGSVPSLLALPPGCAFAPRCARAVAACAQARPPLLPRGGSARRSACFVPIGARVDVPLAPIAVLRQAA
jgi:oligopeptide/dipeptide ABC transporter ATP-binding protein